MTGAVAAGREAGGGEEPACLMGSDGSRWGRGGALNLQGGEIGKMKPDCSENSYNGFPVVHVEMSHG